MDNGFGYDDVMFQEKSDFFDQGEEQLVKV